ncbi:MAG TPA: sulfotransferase domain-containing protein [Candidatus Aquilonibacter sp.]|nr:sulfotransferase domain-containing protein [Candidatus Aquilonibacter sp.]
MIYGIKRVARYLLGTDVAGRALAVYPDDTFIVSYPRSGNTWTRFLVASLVRPAEPVSFANIERIIPDAEAQSSRYLKRIPRPRVIKSHQYFDPRFKKVIYVVRDPRDVALSYYDFQRKYRQIEDSYPTPRYIRDFVAGRLGTGDWGTWAENVGSWLGARDGQPGFLLLRYEDLISETARELARVADFLDIEVTPGLLATTIERGSAHRMRQLERNQASQWVSTKDKRPDIPFIRTASSGGWKKLLLPESASEIESAWGPLMRRLGYELLTGRSERSQPESPEAARLVQESRGSS